MTRTPKSFVFTLTTLLLIIAVPLPSLALSFGEVLGIGTGVFLLDRVRRSNEADRRDRYTPKAPEEEYFRGVRDGTENLQYDNPRNSIEYDRGYQEGVARRRGN